MTNEVSVNIEIHAELIDRLNNVIAAGIIPMDAEIRAKALNEFIVSLRDDVKSVYIEAGGEDHWNTEE